MKSRKLKHFAASGATVALALTVTLVLGSAFTARAQSEDHGSQNTLEGTWRLQVTVLDGCTTNAVPVRTFPAVAAFSKGGPLTVTTAGQPPSLNTTGLGVWRHAEGHRYTAVSESFVFNPFGVWIQTHRLTRAVQIGDDGDTFTDAIALEIFNTNGNLIASGCGTTTATRFK